MIVEDFGSPEEAAKLLALEHTRHFFGFLGNMGTVQLVVRTRQSIAALETDGLPLGWPLALPHPCLQVVPL
jgi:hypothetical protein